MTQEWVWKKSKIMSVKYCSDQQTKHHLAGYAAMKNGGKRAQKTKIFEIASFYLLTYFVIALNTPLMQAICRATNASVNRTPLSS